jgi:hypothetical protein
MQSEFTRGKIIVTTIITIVLFTNGIGIWFTQSWLLRWYGELAQTLTDPVARGSAQTVQTWFVMNQKSFLANQGLNYGVVILLCLMLYLGYGWLRWLWGIHWLVRGLVGTFASVTALLYIEQFSHLLALGLLTSLIYIVCGMTMLFSPAVQAYMNAMRWPATSVRKV